MKIVDKIVILALSSVALCASSVATVTGVKGSAFIYSKSRQKSALLGDKLFSKDRIVTKSHSKLQMIFRDETIVTLGQNSDFFIAKYLYESTQKPTVELGIMAGAMRTITGKIGKIAPQRFRVKTKTATIGIRGTNFSVVVGVDGSLLAYCTYGAISVKTESRAYLIKQDHMIEISPDKRVEVKEFSSKDLKQMKQRYFTATQKRVEKKSLHAPLFVSYGDEGELDVRVEDRSRVMVREIEEKNADVVEAKSSAVVSSLSEEPPSSTPESSLSEEVPSSTPEPSLSEEVPSSTPESSLSEEVPSSTPESSVSEEMPSSTPESSVPVEVPSSTPEPSVSVEAPSSKPKPTIPEEPSSSSEEEVTTALANILAGYSMSNARYSGRYEVTTSRGDTGLPRKGDATLSIDFGKDSIVLVLDPGKSHKNATFNQASYFEGNSFHVRQNQASGAGASELGVANGTFQEPTGNQIKGTFIYNQKIYDSSKGTYDVTTSQTLH